MTGPTNLDTASIAAGRIRAAIIEAELRRERQRLNRPEPLPLEAITTTPPAPSPSPRDDAPAGDGCRQGPAGEK